MGGGPSRALQQEALKKDNHFHILSLSDKITLMIITKSEPFTPEEIVQLQAEFDVYIKTVIDIEKKICSAGMSRHFEGEQILLQHGSKQSTIWGGGIDLDTKEIDFNSFINIRPRDNNPKNEIQSEEIKAIYKKLTEYFFEKIV